MASAARRAWRESRARNGALLVLMAIAFECEKGGEVEMSIAELARKARLSERAARNGVRELEDLKEIFVTPRQGGRSRYALTGTPAESAAPPRQNLHPGRICTPADIAGVKTDTSQVSAPTPAESAAPGISDVLKGSLVSGTGEKPLSSETAREDVERVCRHLADRIEANGSKRPVIGKRWRNAARLLMDNDGRTEQQVHAAIDWCQDDSFWNSRVMSMEKLRQKYDALRLQALEQQKRKQNGARRAHQPTPEEFDVLRERWARPLDQETGNDPSGNGGPGGVYRGSLPPAEN